MTVEAIKEAIAELPEDQRHYLGLSGSMSSITMTGTKKW